MKFFGVDPGVNREARKCKESHLLEYNCVGDVPFDEVSSADRTSTVLL